MEQHKQLLDRVLGDLPKNKLYLNDSKCHLFIEKVNFLGHVVSSDSIAIEYGIV